MSYKDKKQYRLNFFDYSSEGFYFITICTKNREHFLGDIKNWKMCFSKTGEIVYQKLIKIIKNRKNIILEEWIIMPNHLHMVIKICRNAPCDVTKNTIQSKPGEQSSRWRVRWANKMTPWQNPNDVTLNDVNANDVTSNDVTPNDVTSNAPCANGAQNNVLGCDFCNEPWRVPTGIQSLIPNSISSIINHFKGGVTIKCNSNNLYFEWQSRFHDNIICDQLAFIRICLYIKFNPIKWVLKYY